MIKDEKVRTRKDFEKMSQLFIAITLKEEFLKGNRMMIHEICKVNNIRDCEHLCGLLEGKQLWTFEGQGDKIYKLLETIHNVDSKGLVKVLEKVDYVIMFPSSPLNDIEIELMRYGVLGYHCQKMMVYGNY